MKSGSLRHRISIQTPPIGNTGGRRTGDYTNVYADIPAFVQPLRGREYMDAKTTAAEVSHRISLRYLPGILPSMQVLYEARTFQIQSVIDVNEKHREMELMCTEQLA